MLKVRDIDVYYGDLQALRKVGLDVDPGEIVSVIGSNGAGKSTTLKTISGVLRPRTGAIEFDGRPLAGESTSGIVKMGISHIPEGRQLFPTMTVRENLEMGAQFPRTIQAREETMERVFRFFPRLKERLKQAAGTLSGGEQQMVAIGRGLMSMPRLMMLDEPSLGLSPLLVSTIFDIIRQINERGTAILLIEQNVFHSLSISSRGYVLENGEVAMSGTGKELLNAPHIRKTYLGL
ncbi:MAG: ABC transporter ATP-binding protein [Desulfobacterales bacterium]|nr:ABC transporter ATP-binding protein [Desulfobacterales bacterium]